MVELIFMMVLCFVGGMYCMRRIGIVGVNSGKSAT